MKTTRQVAVNPPRKSKLRNHEPRGLTVNVHWECCWIDGCAVGLPRAKLKLLVCALLDSGIPVRGYWADVDYTSIDKRISSEGGRV